MLGLKTPLGRARGLGSARSGTEHFWRERLTAVIGIPLITAFIAIVLATIGVDHATAATRLGHPLVAIVLLLTILNACVHMRIGMQVIIEDYVHGPLTKAVLLMANTGIAVAMGVAGAFAVVKIAVAG